MVSGAVCSTTKPCSVGVSVASTSAPWPRPRPPCRPCRARCPPVPFAWRWTYSCAFRPCRFRPPRSARHRVIRHPRLANTVEHEPGGFRADIEVPVQFHAGDRLEAGQAQVDGDGPLAQGDLGAGQGHADPRSPPYAPGSPKVRRIWCVSWDRIRLWTKCLCLRLILASSRAASVRRCTGPWLSVACPTLRSRPKAPARTPGRT